MAEGTRLDFTILAQPYSPDKDEYIAVLHPVWTTANLADATHRVNTKDKFVGRMVWDSTLGEAVFASGAAAADPWYTATATAPPATATKCGTRPPAFLSWRKVLLLALRGSL